MFIHDYIEKRDREFARLCERNHVKKLYAFGSSVNESFNNSTSDIDLLVEIQEADPIVKGALLLDFLEQAEAFFGRKVDLLSDQPIKNKVFAENVEKNKVLVYDREKQKVSA